MLPSPRRLAAAACLTSLLVAPAFADDVVIQLDPGDALSVQDSTTAEVIRLGDDGGVTLGAADESGLCTPATRGSTKFFERTSGDSLAVCTRTQKGDYLWQDLGGSGCGVVDESTPATNSVIAIGASGSDFYAQSFIADVHRISQIGIYLSENSAGGQVRLAIAPDVSGDPDALNPIWESPLIDPSSAQGWVYLDNLGIDVVPGTRYYVVIDGFGNSGASGTSRAGTSPGEPTDTGDDFVYSNNGGASWTTYSSPLAVHVQGCADQRRIARTYGGTCTIGSGSTISTICTGGFTHTAKEGEVVIAWSSFGIATTLSVSNATRITYSTDGGTSWLDCGSQYYNYGGGSSTLNNGVASTCTMPLIAGQTYEFGIRFAQGTTTGTSFGTITALVLPKQ
jgi:hypothetical protein